MRSKIPLIERDDGAIPVLGLGTWKIDGDRGLRAIRRALDLGYRHIDTAQMYGNEETVGRAIAKSGVDREDFGHDTLAKLMLHYRETACSGRLMSFSS